MRDASTNGHFANRARRRSLITRIHYPHLAIDDLSPRTTTRRRRATIIDAHHEVSLLRQHLVPQRFSPAPAIHHRLSPRLAVNMKQHRITLLRIEIVRLHHPAVELHAFTDIDFEKLRRRLFQLRQTILHLAVIDQRSRHTCCGKRTTSVTGTC